MCKQLCIKVTMAPVISATCLYRQKLQEIISSTETKREYIYTSCSFTTLQLVLVLCGGSRTSPRILS